jgi:predicted nucleic-acid-binding Zn-ribbon protein
MVHLPTLIAAWGPEIDLADLQKRLQCPLCGSDRFSLQIVQPPSSEAGKRDEAPKRRRMRPGEAGRNTLGLSREPWIVFDCAKCGRRGEYRRERLIEEFGSAIEMPGLLEVFAHSRGCGSARPDAGPYDASRMFGRECLIRYDVEG